MNDSMHLCPRCAGIIGEAVPRDPDGISFCPTCDTKFFPDDQCTKCGNSDSSLYAWLKEQQCAFSSTLPAATHTDTLAHMAHWVDVDPLYPMHGLFETLARAQWFVHFVSWGISHVILGALKLLEAKGVVVRGIVSGSLDRTISELATSKNEFESQGMSIVTIPRTNAAAPHQKVVVVDGVVAFKGSANLTMPAWRKVAHDLELIEVVTDRNQVQRLHNQLFARAWLRFGEVLPEGNPLIADDRHPRGVLMRHGPFSRHWKPGYQKPPMALKG